MIRKSILRWLLIALSLASGGCALGERHVVVRVDEPGQTDFIVLCEGSGLVSNPIHGGRSLTIDKVLVVDAGVVTGCGFNLRDLVQTSDRFRVMVWHPVYTAGYYREPEDGLTRDAKGRVVMRDAQGLTVFVARMITNRRMLEWMAEQYTGEELGQKLRVFVSHMLTFMVEDFPAYYREATGHPPDLAQLKRRYNDILVADLEYAAATAEQGQIPDHLRIKPYADPRQTIARMWERMADTLANPR